MSTIVVIKPNGEVINLPADTKLDLRLMYLALGCRTVERIKVRWEGRVRDCYVDEEGLLTRRPFNPKLKELAEAYYGAPCQEFAGSGAIWIPTPRKKKEELVVGQCPACHAINRHEINCVRN